MINKDNMNDFIRMPEVGELKEELANAKSDIQSAIEENPDLAEQSQLPLQVLNILEKKIENTKDLSTLNSNEQISVVAHLNLFYTLLEDIFSDDLEDFEDDEDLFDFENDEEDEE